MAKDMGEIVTTLEDVRKWIEHEARHLPLVISNKEGWYFSWTTFEVYVTRDTKATLRKLGTIVNKARKKFGMDMTIISDGRTHTIGMDGIPK